MSDRPCWSAGHGKRSQSGHTYDPGAVGNNRVEAVETLGFCTRLAKDTAALGEKTYLRDSGTYFTADDDAHLWKASVFTEIHFNAGPKEAHGVECFVGPNASYEEKQLAQLYCAAVSKTLGITNRGVKCREFAVLHQYPNMDSVLLEIGFITNHDDMTKYARKVDALELALLNAYRKARGHGLVNSLPRKHPVARLRIPFNLKRS